MGVAMALIWENFFLGDSITRLAQLKHRSNHRVCMTQVAKDMPLIAKVSEKIRSFHQIDCDSR